MHIKNGSDSEPLEPLGSLQVVIGLFQLPHVFVELLLDAARLAEVVLQHGDLLVTLGVLLLQLLLKDAAQDRTPLGTL